MKIQSSQTSKAASSSLLGDDSVDSLSSSFSSGSVREHRVTLSDGTAMQVLTQLPPPATSPGGLAVGSKSSSSNSVNPVPKPLLVFLHGSFHGSWCWAEHWFEHFVNLGYPVLAPSWRGTGGTFAGVGVKKVPICSHVQDLHELLTQHLNELVPNDGKGRHQKVPRPVVLVSHSFGGLVVMKLLEAYPELLLLEEDEALDSSSSALPPTTRVVGVATLCSVPPSGNGPMTMRYLKRSLRASWKVTAGLAMKKVLTDPELCRELFFATPSDSSDEKALSDADLTRYQTYFTRDSEATIDLLDLARKLPSARIDNDGQAPFVKRLPPCLVVGAKHDFIVDPVGAQETAQYYGLDEPLWVDSPHDIMLTPRWTETATVVAQWLSEAVVKDSGGQR